MGLYTDILERKDLSAGRRAFIWDVHGKKVVYDFTAIHGTRRPHTLWQDYEACLDQAEEIIDQRKKSLPAYSGACKLCHWYSACLSRLADADDLTLIPYLGRSKRDAMLSQVATIRDFAEADISSLVVGKKTVFAGIGRETLEKLHARAQLITKGEGAKPYLRKSVELPRADTELFFDIEVDPMRDICYLHGFVERHGGDNNSERFVYFVAEEVTPNAEREAFAGAWRYMRESQPCVIYYYSKYERTIYRKLCQKYPDVCSDDELEALFHPARAIDLYYDVVLKATEWPTRDYSIKTLATYLGFSWRDTHPSGAASIEWFDKWIRTGDPTVRQRILNYNEDDCRATRVVLDGIRAISEPIF